MVQRSLAQMLANLDEKLLQDIVDNNYATQDQVVSLCLDKLTKVQDLKAMHSSIFGLSKNVAEKLATIQSVNADTVNALLLSIAPVVRQRPSRPIEGVIKSVVKTKHSKVTPEVKRITPKVVQAFVKNVLLTGKQTQLLQSGVARNVVDSLVGVPIDPVQGIGAADPNIWGPVVV